MKKGWFLLLSILMCVCVRAQTSQISGVVTDTSEHRHLRNSLITVLRQSDSLLLSYTRSDSSGRFQLSGMSAGKAIILISYPGFADYIDFISVRSDSLLSIGTVNMTRKSQLLQEVIVSNAAAIRIKGDTTEYKVDSFHLRAGATVEDLLKKLPGIQVDKDGKITAQGETVRKVLVDGEEFFSDDPTVVTQNMLSEAVDKVQVYDKKSDQSAFTGIDDGKKTKTIDLKLKDDHKKGLFGKVEAGTDFNKFWNNSAMMNAFRGKRKFAAYGVMSNTGKTGLDWSDNVTYNGSDGMEMNYEDGGISIMNSGDGDELDNSSYWGAGLPTGWNAGMLYSNKWNADKTSLSGSYQYKKLNTAASGYTKSKYILPDTLYYNNEDGSNWSSKFRHSLKGIYEYKTDSSSSIKVLVQGSKGQTNSLSHSSSESLDDRAALVNRSDRDISSNADNSRLKADVLYRNKFKKQGRTLSVKFGLNTTENNSDGLLKASYDYFDRSGAITRATVTDQKKLRDISQSNSESRIVYTEPLSKRSVLEFNYGVTTASGHSAITTLQEMVPGSGKYEYVVDSLSSDYKLRVVNNSAGVNYRYAKAKKFNYSFGANLARADYQRVDLKGDSSFSYHYINFFPRANLNMTLEGGGRFSFGYNGNTQAPTVDQLQPIRDNSNELDQTIGNTNLKQSFNHRFYSSFEHFKLLSNRVVYISASYTLTENDFSVTNFVDKLGRRIWQPVNVQGNYSGQVWSFYNKKLGKSAFNFEFSGSYSLARNTNFINGLQNINHSSSVNAGPGLRYSREKKLELSSSVGVGRSWATSSLRPDEPTAYWTLAPRIDSRVFLPLKFELSTDCSFDFRQKTDAFNSNNNVVLWNASLDRKWLKNDKAILRLAAFDLLDQNLNIQRDVSSNFITERNYNTIRRHFMLSIIYNFNSSPNAPK